MKLLCLLLAILGVNSIYFEVVKRVCLGAEELPNQSYHMHYEVTTKSDLEPKINVSVVDKHGATIAYEQESYKYLEISGNISFTVCFINPDSELKYVTMDLFTDSSSKIKELASKSDIYDLHMQLNHLSESMRNISRGQKFQQERQDLHTEIVLEIQRKIKWLGTAKILLIVLLAVVEIMVLRWILSKQDKLAI